MKHHRIAAADVSRATCNSWIAMRLASIGRDATEAAAVDHLFGADPEAARRARQFGAALLVRAAVSPASTTAPGWASELVATAVRDVYATPPARSALAQLLERDTVAEAPFGPGIGQIRLPFDATPVGDPRSEFFGEGAPIRVADLEIGGVDLSVREAGIIVPWTRKLEKFSAIDLGAFVERVLRRHAALRIDSVLLSDDPRTALSPGGLLAFPGTTSVAATGDAAADIAGLIGLLPAGADAVVIANPRTLTPLYGDPVLAPQLPGGRLMGAELLLADGCPVDEVWALDASAFAVGYAAPDFELARSASLHMEDSAPLPIVDGTPASPVRSLHQTASRAIRMILGVDWAVAAGGAHRLTGFGA